MRHLAVILIAMFAVACTKADEHKADATLSDTGHQLEAAGKTAAVEVKKGYEKAKPELKKAGKEIKAKVHDATAPSDGG